MRCSPFIRIAKSIYPSRLSSRSLLSAGPSYPLNEGLMEVAIVSFSTVFLTLANEPMPPWRRISTSIGCLFNLRIRRFVCPKLRQKGTVRSVQLNLCLKREKYFIFRYILPFFLSVRKKGISTVQI